MTSNRLYLTPISSKHFTVSRKMGCLVTTASDLPSLKMQRIYNDACDTGIAIISARTDVVVYFYLNEVRRDEGGITSWNFKVLPGVDEERANGIKSVVIYND